jgi:GNAT superfamily N-acetyltransferase
LRAAGLRSYSCAIDPRYVITLARSRDLPQLAAIELAAAALLDGHAPPSVLNETTDEAELRAAQADGRLWVALDRDAPVGFLQIDLLAPDMPHIEEVGVHPRHGRRGIGAALVRAACGWAERSGHETLTLTTFRAVPFNMPFYAKLGFEEVPASELRPELATVVRNEAGRGLAVERRVVMRYRTKAGIRGQP